MSYFVETVLLQPEPLISKAVVTYSRERLHVRQFPLEQNGIASIVPSSGAFSSPLLWQGTAAARLPPNRIPFRQDLPYNYLDHGSSKIGCKDCRYYLANPKINLQFDSWDSPKSSSYILHAGLVFTKKTRLASTGCT